MRRASLLCLFMLFLSLAGCTNNQADKALEFPLHVNKVLYSHGKVVAKIDADVTTPEYKKFEMIPVSPDKLDINCFRQFRYAFIPDKVNPSSARWHLLDNAGNIYVNNFYNSATVYLAVSNP